MANNDNNPRNSITLPEHAQFFAVSADEELLLREIQKTWETYTKLLNDWYLMTESKDARRDV